jgi:DNA-binding response OmpR family regulator
MKILVIEPNRLLGETYRAALEQAGHRVNLCFDAQSAVHAADKETPELVVVELQTPRHSGIEFLYEFRSYAEWQAIPVLIHTFVPRQNLEPRQLEQLGITQYLYKPGTTLQQLKRAVAEAAAVTA